MTALIGSSCRSTTARLDSPFNSLRIISPRRGVTPRDRNNFTLTSWSTTLTFLRPPSRLSERDDSIQDQSDHLSMLILPVTRSAWSTVRTGPHRLVLPQADSAGVLGADSAAGMVRRT